MPRFRPIPPALALAAALSACGQVDYQNVDAGTFSGNLLVMWLGEGSSSAGDGKFLFVPNTNDPLTFTWTDGKGRERSIRPQMMYTDGGSIPRIGQVFNGFGPWGYAPAYMVHDWLYVARHCNVDQTPTPAEATVADIAFDEDVQGVALYRSQRIQIARIGERIQVDDLHAAGDGAQNEITPNETGSAGD